MTTPQEKTRTLWWFIESKSITQTQRNYRRVYQKDLHRETVSILQWKRKFLETGSVLNKKSPGRHCRNDVDVESVRETFLHSPQRSMRSAARELDMPVSTVHKVLRKN
ncbi:hypothetical protein AVEN_88452-1 [Araneus ventricosus]|uniref:DUF4817 domain-containing protein n=1 Tax=Araneus ventricosus TaxID=182803 RepID=A0A4Y2JH79_ARAVE|nr:hypothetical protein AVEN_88452-1 [Araneus ventricosus]